MKKFRIICLVVAVLWIAFLILAFFVMLFEFIDSSDARGFLEGSFGLLLFASPTVILLIVARTIKRNLEKKEKQALIDSFENI